MSTRAARATALLQRRFAGAPGWLLLFVAVVVVAAVVLLLVRPGEANARASKPAHPTAVFIGDSYTQGVGATSPADRWTTLVADRLGWREVNLGRGGTGYVTSAGVDGCGLSYCPDYQEMVPTAVDDDPDIVVVSGGQNDFSAWTSDSHAVVAGIDQVFHDLRQSLPMATIYAIGPSTTGTVEGPVVAMNSAVQAAAEANSAHYISLIRPDVIEPSMVLKDGGHVDNAGHRAIANRVVSAIERTRSS